MPLKSRLLSIGLILALLSLACLGLADDPPPDNYPATTPTSLPISTATPGPGSGPTQPNGLETATVVQVVDGDTVELADGRRIRYIGINTPERNQPYYNEAREANRQLVEGKTIGLEFDVDTFDQYGRNLAYVWVAGMLANWEIVNRGFANAFTVPPNVRYDSQIRAAEGAAREAGRGLWAGSEVALKIIQIEADAPGNDSQNPNGEWIEIANQGETPVQANGYTLKDEANHIYTFGDFTVPPGRSFRLYSGQGQNSPTELYWGLSGESVWNNSGDAAFLRDGEGALVDSYSY